MPRLSRRTTTTASDPGAHQRSADGGAGRPPSLPPLDPPRPEPGPVPAIVRLRLRLRRRPRQHRATVVLALVAGGLVGAGAAGAGPVAGPLAPLGLAPDRGPGAGVAAAPGPDAPAPTVEDEPGPDRSTAAGRLGLAPGERAVALVAPVALPPLEPGDEVELVAVRVDEAGSVAAQALGGPARVLALDDGAVTVALPSAEAVAVLRHQAEGPIEIVVR